LSVINKMKESRGDLKENGSEKASSDARNV
jgi:hypothetical protein